MNMEEPQCSPVSRYLTDLFLELVKSGTCELVLTRSAGLPDLGERVKIPEDGFRRVTNRLKVLAGITPMKYSVAQVGAVEIQVGKRKFIITMEFHDYAEDPFATLHLIPMSGVA